MTATCKLHKHAASKLLKRQDVNNNPTGITQMMNLKTLSMITLTAVAFGSGCGSDSNPGGTGGTGNSTSTGGNGNTGGGAVGGNGGTAPACTNSLNEGQGLDLSAADNNFVTAIYAFGDTNNGAVPSTDTDPASTFCIVQPDGTTGQMCMNGTGAMACGGTTPCDYHRWGAGIGMNLATHAATGEITAPFDATAANVAGVKFTLAGPPATGIRLQLTMADDPATAAYNEPDHAFVWQKDGTGPYGEVMADGTFTAMFADFVQPPWGCNSTTNTGTNPCGAGVDMAMNLTLLDAIQFQVPTAETTETPYNFCLSGIEFVDASGATVTPPAGSGGAGGSGGAP